MSDVKLGNLIASDRQNANPDKDSHFIGLDLRNEKIEAICAAFNITSRKPSVIARALFQYAFDCIDKGYNPKS